MILNKRKGRMIYVPPSVLDEADNIMSIKGYTKRSKALKDLTQYARVGMEAEKILKLDFNPFGVFKKSRRTK